jgi:hypothetical protein
VASERRERVTNFHKIIKLEKKINFKISKISKKKKEIKINFKISKLSKISKKKYLNFIKYLIKC